MISLGHTCYSCRTSLTGRRFFEFCFCRFIRNPILCRVCENCLAFFFSLRFSHSDYSPRASLKTHWTDKLGRPPPPPSPTLFAWTFKNDDIPFRNRTLAKRHLFSSNFSRSGHVYSLCACVPSQGFDSHRWGGWIPVLQLSPKSLDGYFPSVLFSVRRTCVYFFTYPTTELNQ